MVSEDSSRMIPPTSKTIVLGPVADVIPWRSVPGEPLSSSLVTWSTSPPHPPSAPAPKPSAPGKAGSASWAASGASSQLQAKTPRRHRVRKAPGISILLAVDRSRIVSLPETVVPIPSFGSVRWAAVFAAPVCPAYPASWAGRQDSASRNRPGLKTSPGTHCSEEKRA